MMKLRDENVKLDKVKNGEISSPASRSTRSAVRYDFNARSKDEVPPTIPLEHKEWIPLLNKNAEDRRPSSPT